MGGGIVQTFLEAGFRVVLKEVDEPRALASRSAIEASLTRRAARNARSAEVEEVLTRLSVRTTLPANDEVALVIESVPEDVNLKRALLNQLSTMYRRAIIATNTSALSIDELAADVDGPDRFVGLHFFNPVPVSALVEIVRGKATHPAVIQQCHSIAQRIGKESIEVRDSPGFATSRLGIAIGLEAMRMLEEQVASAEDIDLGMVKGYRLPIGPLELSDTVGLDVRLAIADHLHRELGERFRAPDVLRQLVSRGDLGRKTGRGFYEWGADGKRTGA